MPDEGAEPEEDGARPLSLSEPERALLTELKRIHPALREEGALASELHLPADAVRGSLQRLRSKRLASVAETHDEILRLTRRGQDAQENGLPERRLLTRLAASGGKLEPAALADQSFDDEERSAAVGILRRRGYLAPGVPFRLTATAPDPAGRLPEERVLASVAAGDTPSEPGDAKVVDALRKRGLLVLERQTTRRWAASAEGVRLPVAADDRPLVGALTTDMLRTGAWRAASFRPYDVRAQVPYVTGARPHPYAAWLKQFEEILVGLGFEQAEGPLLETEFWNADVLFMPQEHPARSIHDVLNVVDVKGHPPTLELLERVRAMHEGRPLPGQRHPVTPGWGKPYDPAIAARPVLRSQTTAVSARFLAAHPTPPFRMFCLDRNFRRESLDATHHIEFGQCEGIVGQEGITLRHLVGIFQSLAAAIGVKELRIRPSYFPFTEPSIEGYVKHPRLGWMEVFPGGLFRPEVLQPLGIQVPVAAWGIGSTRLAMVALGVNDIRELYLDDLDRLTSGRL